MSIAHGGIALRSWLLVFFFAHGGIFLRYRSGILRSWRYLSSLSQRHFFARGGICFTLRGGDVCCSWRYYSSLMAHFYFSSLTVVFFYCCAPGLLKGRTRLILSVSYFAPPRTVRRMVTVPLSRTLVMRYGPSTAFSNVAFNPPLV